MTKAGARIVIVGPPGAGKGTQAITLSQHLGIPHISTGEMLRDAVAAGSELGLKVKQLIDSGELVPDDLMTAVVKDRLQRPDCDRGFLLDGYPRTLSQANSLDTLLADLNLELTHILEISVPEQLLIERIIGRAQAGSGRSDDNHAVATRRLQVFWQQTSPVIQYYRTPGRAVGVSEVDGVGTVEEVSRRLLGFFS